MFFKSQKSSINNKYYTLFPFPLAYWSNYDLLDLHLFLASYSANLSCSFGRLPLLRYSQSATKRDSAKNNAYALFWCLSLFRKLSSKPLIEVDVASRIHRNKILRYPDRRGEEFRSYLTLPDGGDWNSALLQTAESGIPRRRVEFRTVTDGTEWNSELLLTMESGIPNCHGQKRVHNGEVYNSTLSCRARSQICRTNHVAIFTRTWSRTRRSGLDSVHFSCVKTWSLSFFCNWIFLYRGTGRLKYGSKTACRRQIDQSEENI